MARGQKIGVDDRMESVAEAVSRFPFFDASITRMIGWPVEAWLRAQAGILQASQPLATGWLERRRHTTERREIGELCATASSTALRWRERTRGH